MRSRDRAYGAILTLGGGLLCSLTLTPGVRIRLPLKGE